MRYIDADRLIDDIRPFAEYDSNRRNKDWVRRFEIAIDDQPTADVRENVKGEWIEDNPREKSMMWRCSVCGRIAYYPIIGERKSYKKHCGYNFCPNCGADMRGDNNEMDSMQ